MELTSRLATPEDVEPVERVEDPAGGGPVPLVRMRKPIGPPAP